MSVEQPIKRDLNDTDWIFAGTTEAEDQGRWEVFSSEAEAMAAADEFMNVTPEYHSPNAWVARVTRVVTSYWDHRPKEEAGL